MTCISDSRLDDIVTSELERGRPRDVRLIQAEVEAGFVRHSMYAGAFLLIFVMPVALGSFCGAAHLHDRDTHCDCTTNRRRAPALRGAPWLL